MLSSVNLSLNLESFKMKSASSLTTEGTFPSDICVCCFKKKSAFLCHDVTLSQIIHGEECGCHFWL